MAAIPTIQQIAQKWAAVTPLRSADYEAGIRSPRRDWATSTAAAADAWRDGVDKARQGGLFERGVANVGTQKWQSGALNKGVARWGPGVSVAQNDYAAGFNPYRNAIEAVTLPPRFARRDPRNMSRVQAIVDAMIATKESLMRAGGGTIRGGGLT